MNSKHVFTNEQIMQANMVIYGFRIAGGEEEIIKLAKTALEALEPENKAFVLKVAMAIVEANK